MERPMSYAERHGLLVRFLASFVVGCHRTLDICWGFRTKRLSHGVCCLSKMPHGYLLRYLRVKNMCRSCANVSSVENISNVCFLDKIGSTTKRCTCTAINMGEILGQKARIENFLRIREIDEANCTYFRN